MTNSGEAIKILKTVSSIIPLFQSVYPEASFGFMGSSSVSRSGNYTESADKNQRFVVYRQLAQRWVGINNYRHFEIPKISSYLLVTRHKKANKEKNRIVKMMLKTYPNLHEQIIG